MESSKISLTGTEAVSLAIDMGGESLSGEQAARTEPQDIAETLYILKLGLRTNLRWLDRESPNVDAAVRTSTRLCECVEQLEVLMRRRSM
ncbi:hypothetical protein [Rhizobium sp. AB2/73]|uniref:hypothetical protein n=1 Tax=Rhizobium sp. AB2/73 TaxID=2795216 RepID=UPI000DDD5F2B|nr:hypothetical protein [Rhizobium sp. AB2/73]QYA17436.1 hypothetical protein J5284_33750 [Rhizobium sp. AB2/73]UEQ85757.1 hypothetical protein I8E17_33730 [Rhizobium sp. AB2/73]